MPNESKLRVTRLITWLPVGGIERRLVSVLPRLAAREFDVRLVCLREYGPLADELRDAGVPVDLIPLRSRLDPFGIGRLAMYFREHRTQIIHAHMYRASVPGTIAARMANVPVIFSQVHNVRTWESSRQAALDRFLCRWRTGVFCVSKAVQDDVRQTLRLAPERAPVLYNGVDTEAFQPDESLRVRTREALGLGAETIAVLIPARLHSQKNPFGVLKAFEEAASDRNAVLLFAGSGPMEEAMCDAIEKKGLGAKVRLLGRRDDMAALYNAADVMLLSSFKEGFSNAVVEALACGCPVIAADVGGNREAVNSPRIGWIHPAGNHEALVAQLNESLQSRASLRARQNECRQRGLEFSLDQLVENTAKFYREAYGAARK